MWLLRTLPFLILTGVCLEVQAYSNDEENRLVQFNGPSPQVIYGYNDEGTRLWRNVNGAALTVWIGGIYENRAGKHLCHVHANGQLIATFEPAGEAFGFIPRTPVVARAADTLERWFAWQAVIRAGNRYVVTPAKNLATKTWKALRVKDVGLASKIRTSGMEPDQAANFFGWGKGAQITKSAATFTRQSLEAAGWTKSRLLDVAKAYRKIAEITPNNPAAIPCAQQLESLARLFP